MMALWRRGAGAFAAGWLVLGCAEVDTGAFEPAGEVSAATGRTEALAYQRQDAASQAPPVVAQPSAVPLPVVLVAGLMQTEETVAPLADALRDAGYEVAVWVPPNSGLGDIHEYAQQLEMAVDQVLLETGAERIHLVGHSEGGVTARTYVKRVGDGAPVHTLVALGSPQQGTEGGLLSLILRFIGCELWAPACRQMVAGSPFMEELNGGDPTPGDVRYLAVGTVHDGVVQPAARASIPGGEFVVMQTNDLGWQASHG